MLILLPIVGFAQSDDCKDAEEIVVQENCITKAGFTNDFTNPPLDNTCGSNTDDDGWYKFKAISDITIISVSSTASTDMGIAIYVDCERERTCTDRTATGGREEIVLPTQIGTTYWIQIYDVRTGPGAFFICVSAPPKDPISDCDQAEVICTSGAISFNPTGPGLDDFATDNNEQGCLLSKENQSAWYYFEIETDVPPNLNLDFVLTPDNSPDYDFAIFGPNVACDSLGFPIRCSYADRDCAFCPSTGLGMETLDAGENAQGDGFVRQLPVQAGEGYFLLIDNFSSTATGFLLEWGGTAAPYLDCKAVPPCGLFVQTDEVLYVCEETELELGANIQIADELQGDAITYFWEGREGASNYLDDLESLTPTLTFPDNFADTLLYLLTAKTSTCKHSDLLMVVKNCLSETAQCESVIELNLDLIVPNCAEPSSGSIQITPLGGTAPFQYQIENDDCQSANVFTKRPEGSYRITVKDAFGCRLDTLVELSDTKRPTLDLGVDTTINQGETIPLSAELNIPPKQIRTLNWENIFSDTCATPCLQLNFSPPFSRSVAVNGITADGCVLQDEVFITVIPKSDIFIPSAFSPNGDQVNEVFTIYTGTGIRNIRMLRIFNRWGDLVFEAKDVPPSQEAYGWDGTFRGRPLESGIFLYVVEIEMPDGSLQTLTGALTLLE
ncbi:MAG: gliding motility-associated C-terminal domain-containing protein [Bacteroidota bacterium]